MPQPKHALAQPLTTCSLQPRSALMQGLSVATETAFRDYCSATR